MGVSSGASGLGATFMPLLAGATVVALGWRGSFVCIALVVLLIGLPIQFFLLVEPPALQPRDTGALGHPVELEGLTAREAFRTSTFWLLLTSLPIGGGILIAVATTTVPILMDRGVSLAIATGAIAATGLTSSIGEATIGFLLDHSRTPRRLSPFYVMAILGLLMLLLGHSATAILAGALVGVGMAGEFSALSFMISRYFGRKAFGRICGVGFGFMLVVASIATVGFNAVYDQTGSYRLAVLAIIPLLIWNVLAPLLMGPYRYHAGADVPLLEA
jgi:MFS family permease